MCGCIYSPETQKQCIKNALNINKLDELERSCEKAVWEARRKCISAKMEYFRTKASKQLNQTIPYRKIFHRRRCNTITLLARYVNVEVQLILSESSELFITLLFDSKWMRKAHAFSTTHHTRTHSTRNSICERFLINSIYLLVFPCHCH